MAIAVQIRDETSQGDVIAESVVSFPVEKVNVRELIETRVDQEAEVAHISKSMRRLMDRLDDDEVSLNIQNRHKSTKPDKQKHKKLAVEAFQRGEFILFVNDRQFTELDEEMLVTPNTVIRFLRLVPLVGG
jgi:hypothetical protein